MRHCHQQVEVARSTEINHAAALERTGPTIGDLPQKLLDTTQNDRDGVTYQFALAGLRRADIAGMCWSAVDMDPHTLSIKDTRVTVDGHAVDSTTKTTRSTRVLPIPDPVYAALLYVRAAKSLDRVET